MLGCSMVLSGCCYAVAKETCPFRWLLGGCLLSSVMMRSGFNAFLRRVYRSLIVIRKTLDVSQFTSVCVHTFFLLLCLAWTVRLIGVLLGNSLLYVTQVREHLPCVVVATGGERWGHLGNINRNVFCTFDFLIMKMFLVLNVSVVMKIHE